MESASPQPKPPSLVHDSDFMKFWIGQSISVFGAQFSPFAIQAIAISFLAATDTQLGILAFLNTIAFLSLGLFVGVYADRHRRRRIMIYADFGRAAVLFTIPLAFFTWGLSMNLLYVVTLLAGILTLFFEIAYQANIPNLVPKAQIVEANSKMETTRSISQAAGPPIAGFVVKIIQAPLAVFADCVGYLTSSFSLLLLRRPEVMDESHGPRSTWHDIREGLSIVYGDKRLRAIAATTATSNLFASAWGAIAIVYLHNNLGQGYDVIGLAFGIGSIGGIIGALTASRLIKRVGVGKAIIMSIGALGPAPIAFYFATPQTAFFIAAAVFFVGSLGALLYNIPQVSYRQALVPREVQGRMNATMRTIVWGTLPLGGLMGGVVGDVIGTQATIGVMTILGSFAFLWVLFSPVRHVKEMPTD